MSRLRILCFGDSLTAGFSSGQVPGQPTFHPYRIELERQLLKALPGVKLEIVDDGVPGQCATEDAFTRRMETHLKDSLDWVIVLGGTNDLGMGFLPDPIFASLKQVYDMALNSKAKVLALTVPECYFKNEELDAKRNAINDRIIAYDRPGHHSLDLRTAIPYHSISESERKRYWDDGVHLTADGYDWMGGKIAAALIPLLGELSQTT